MSKDRTNLTNISSDIDETFSAISHAANNFSLSDNYLIIYDCEWNKLFIVPIKPCF